MPRPADVTLSACAVSKLNLYLVCVDNQRALLEILDLLLGHLLGLISLLSRARNPEIVSVATNLILQII